MKAIVNALHVLESTDYVVEKIIINRDNVNAVSGKNGNEIQKLMTNVIKRIKKKSITPIHMNYGGKYVEFRHVKAHSHTNNPRHWVNDWCDKQCKAELKKYKQQLENNIQ